MNDAAANPIRGIEAIVVGASAGGVEALLSIFSDLPDTFGLPIVAVLHLPDERRSQLAEVFSRRLRIPVREGQDKEAIKPGTLYFAGQIGRASCRERVCQYV